MKNLLIIGAGGHGKVVYDIAESTCRFASIFFLDDGVSIGKFYKSEIIGSSLDINKYRDDYSFIVAVGSNAIREKIQSKLIDIHNARIETLVHSSAVILTSAKIGVGTVVMPNVVVNSDTKIGKGAILNTASVIEHDCNIGKFCHISPNATVCGTVDIGDKSWIGAGATIINNLNICDDAIIGAGSVVVKNVVKSAVYTGLVK
ncbi:acetyltransferase [Francisellaceae bacterium CB299]